MLILDAGDVVYGTAGYAKLKADFYARSLPYMAYDAVGMGEMEARFVKESGSSRPYGDSVPIINANVEDASSGKLLAAEPYVIRKTPAGVRVGIISVLGERLIEPDAQQRLGIRVLPPAEALRRHLEKLRKKSDLVILLSHADAESSKRLASEVQGVDVIISGHMSGVSQEAPEQIGTAPFMQTRPSGKYVGKLALEIGADGKIASFAGEYAAMGSDLEDDPEIVKLLAQHDEGLQKYYVSLRAQAASYVRQQPGQPHPFVTALKCRECHVGEYDSWLKMDHAKAFESLRKDSRTADPECVSCHTTGFKSKGGFTSEAATPQFRAVQCEACHGPGVIHARRPAKGFGAVSQLTCVQCHNPARSPEFKYAEYVQRIAHRSGNSGDSASHASEAK